MSERNILAGRAAAWLDAEHASRRKFSPLAGVLMPANITAAYDIQDALAVLRSQAGSGERAGFKIALTTPQMRQFVGYDDSIAGQIPASAVHRSPARIRLGDAVHLGFECELAFRVGSATDPHAPPATRAGIAAHIDAVCVAFELIDDRAADYALFGRDDRATMLSLAADNAWNHGVVLGQWKEDWQALDLAALRGIARINALEVGAGYGRDVLGHPLDAMLWIARHLHGRGLGLLAGEFVITGSLVTSKFPAVGDQVSFAVDGVGEVRMDIGA